MADGLHIAKYSFWPKLSSGLPDLHNIFVEKCQIRRE